MNSTILNSPYFEPKKHFASDDRGITENILETRLSFMALFLI
jgi:hypothetical protein